MDLFLLKLYASISTKTSKYLQNPRFSRKLHHDSPIERTETSDLYRPIELVELYRTDSFLLKFHACTYPKTAKHFQNLRFSRKLHHDSPIEGTKNLKPTQIDRAQRALSNALFTFSLTPP